MTTYNTYAECKINHPEDNIYHADGFGFAPGSKPQKPQRFGFWKVANPADHCMSLEAFFEAGHKFVVGDIYLNKNGIVKIVGKDIGDVYANIRTEFDSVCFVLSAKALEDNAEQVEWKNGDECVFEGRDCVFVHSNPVAESAIIVDAKGVPAMSVPFDMLSKPETPEQKKEREREMAIYDMCSAVDNHAEEARFWAERFYDAGYRKPE